MFFSPSKIFRPLFCNSMRSQLVILFLAESFIEGSDISHVAMGKKAPKQYKLKANMLPIGAVYFSVYRLPQE